MQTRRKFLQAVSTSGLVFLGRNQLTLRNSRSSEIGADRTVSRSAKAGNFGLTPMARPRPRMLSIAQMTGRPCRCRTRGSLSVDRRTMSELRGTAFVLKRRRAGFAARRIEFEAVNHTADVFLNGKALANTLAKATPRSLSIFHLTSTSAPKILSWCAWTTDPTIEWFP